MWLLNFFKLTPALASSINSTFIIFRMNLQNKMLTSYVSAVFWYAAFGILHELSHVITAKLLIESPCGPNSIVDWVEILLNRRFHLHHQHDRYDEGDADVDGNGNGEDHYEFYYFIIRQSGWMFSVLIAYMVHYFTTKEEEQRSQGQGSRDDRDDRGTPDTKFTAVKFAAYLTAIDAVWTDLLLMKPLFMESTAASASISASISAGISTSTTAVTAATAATAADTVTRTCTFYCGNFGVILLNSVCLVDNDGIKSTLGVLKKMIEVTMMRGAQSGGIVTFKKKNNNKKILLKDSDHGGGCGVMAMKGIRSRVVKSKRGDL